MSDMRDKLLQAAGPIFAEKGFDGATVREICDAAGANLAAVNYHFGDKESLYVETVRHASKLRQQQVPMPERAIGTDPEVRMRDFIVTLAKRMLGDDRAPWEPRLMMREVLDPTEACERMANEYFRPFLNQLMAAISQLAPEPLTEHQQFRLAFSVVGQLMHYRLAGKVMQMLVGEDSDFLAVEKIAEHVFQFSLAAVRGYQTSPQEHPLSVEE